jgi:hypothetical protein
VRKALDCPRCGTPVEGDDALNRLEEQFEALREALEMIAADPYPGVPNHAAQIVARNALSAVSSPADIQLTPEQIEKAQSEIQMRAEIYGSSPASMLNTESVTPDPPGDSS